MPFAHDPFQQRQLLAKILRQFIFDPDRNLRRSGRPQTDHHAVAHQGAVGGAGEIHLFPDRPRHFIGVRLELLKPFGAVLLPLLLEFLFVIEKWIPAPVIE